MTASSGDAVATPVAADNAKPVPPIAAANLASDNLVILWTPSPTFAPPQKRTATTSAERLPSLIEGTRPPGRAPHKRVIARHPPAVTIRRSGAFYRGFRRGRNRLARAWPRARFPV